MSTDEPRQPRAHQHRRQRWLGGAYGALPQGDYTVRLTVIDGGGEEASVSQRISVLLSNQDPTCAFTAPEDGSSAGVGDEVRFEADVSDPDGDDGDLSVALESDRDGGLTDGSIRVADGSITASVSDLSAGTHVISLLVDDPFGGSCISQLTLRVGNAPELGSPRRRAVRSWERARSSPSPAQSRMWKTTRAT